MIKKIILFSFLFFGIALQSQIIKTIQLRPNQANNYSVVVPMGTILTLSFDDLEADSKDYYYKIELMTYDWKTSRLLPNQYINGFQKNIILNFNNSFNTLQNYTHYEVQIPNKQTQITKSGNYLVTILDEYDDPVFSRRFTLFENIAFIGAEISRSRNNETFKTHQSFELSVNYPNLNVNNPDQEIFVSIVQNNIWNTAKTDLKPTFYKPNQLIIDYTNNSNFAGGNEYLNFDNKILRNKSLNIRKIEQKDIWYHYLYPLEFNSQKKYTYNPDINGQFLIRALEGNNPDTEADYVNVNFEYKNEEFLKEKEIYVFGAFNDFQLTEENKMYYDKKTNSYKANILLKQGFYNYTFVSKNSDNPADITFLNGNFHQTENEYTIIAYYRKIGGLSDRAIGANTLSFKGEQ